MKIALAAVGLKNKDVEYSKSVIIKHLCDFSGKADLIVFGEAFLQGFDSLKFEYETDKEMAVEASGEVISEIAMEAKKTKVAVSFGFMEKEGNRLYSSQITINQNGEMIDIYRRISQGWKEPFADEHYAEGERFHTFEFMDKSFSVALCGDLWEEGNVPAMQSLHAEVVIWPVYTDFNYKEWNEQIKLEYAEQVKELGSCVLHVNSYCLEQEDENMARGGAAWFCDGSIKEELPAGQEAVLLVTM